MAYNNYNTLLRMVKVQEIVLEHKKHGATQIWIYNNVIFPMYQLSYSTFNRYISYPAKLELKKKQEERRKKKELENLNQLSLF